MNAFAIYSRLQKIPFGTEIFSKGVCIAAPYFSSIKPRISELKPGLCQVDIKMRRSVQNHFKTVHAIAMCNMAELSAGMMTDVSIPKGGRWIPVGMEVEYLKKAKTDLTAVADGSAIDWHTEGDVTVPVMVTDVHDVVVFSAKVRMNIKAA